MVNGTIKARNRVYRCLEDYGYPLGKLEIAKATGTRNSIEECLFDLIRIGWVKRIEYLNNNIKYIVIEEHKLK